MSENTNDNIYIPKEGFIYRSKNNPNDFSRWIRIGTGASIDDYDLVPVSVYEEYQIEQKEKMNEEMGMVDNENV